VVMYLANSSVFGGFSQPSNRSSQDRLLKDLVDLVVERKNCRSEIARNGIGCGADAKTVMAVLRALKAGA
jgi:hypothetical protein